MYNAKFEDLTFEYKITSIRFEDYELIFHVQ